MRERRLGERMSCFVRKRIIRTIEVSIVRDFSSG